MRNSFQVSSTDYRAGVLGTAPRVAIEAAGTFGWSRYVVQDEDAIGLRGFGASAPAERLYEEFRITCAAIVVKARAMIG